MPYTYYMYVPAPSSLSILKFHVGLQIIAITFFIGETVRANAVSTDYTLSPWLDLPGFWPGTEKEWEAWPVPFWFDIESVNKLVSLAGSCGRWEVFQDLHFRSASVISRNPVILVKLNILRKLLNETIGLHMIPHV